MREQLPESFIQKIFYLLYIIEKLILVLKLFLLYSRNREKKKKLIFFALNI